MKSYAALLCSLVFFLACPAVASTQQPISLENWATHPDVKEVRAIYNEIKSGIRSKKYKAKVRRFNIESPLCSTYPVKYEILVIDAVSRPRVYQIERIGSHREPITVGRYYDVNGKLRFVYEDRLISNVRIYLDREGKVIWAVRTNNDKITTYDSNNQYWETKLNNATGAKEEFQSKQLCPEVTK